ncbi:hypothetical protein PV11_00716 [Exophiala sideris]|uniref:Acyltransferase 3 domain-containing protein n=1 Tax=Exophiala sideris TaxID=1016849 RepID=A0A0D1XAR6_9EURO|nr:hypothetical protein PV11_00716 [Exophiala sideris]
MDTVKEALRRTKYFQLSSEVKEQALKDTTWVHGLKGIAAVLVVSSHLVLCYARNLIPPCCAPGSTSPSLLQWPVFRLVASGHSWVAIFFIVMGFVNALKPLKLARSGQAEEAHSKLASSSFSRIFRLVLPATAATIISWFICNIGLYERASLSDAYWLNENTPLPSSTWLHAFPDLLDGLTSTWMFGFENQYDQPQWALVYLLQGSVMIISVLLLVTSMTPLWRTVTLVILSIWSLNWSWMIGDPWTGLCCFAGIMLAELSLSKIPKAAADLSPYLSPLLIPISLFLMSYPGSYAESAGWSNWLHENGIRFLPEVASENLDRMYGSLGGILLMVGIIISPHARWVLSQGPLVWLGEVSFAIYLLHGMLLRTVFAWVLQIGQPLTPFGRRAEDGAEYRIERYPVPGFLHCTLATIVLALCVAGASHVWNMKLEPLFGKITNKLEGIMTAKSSVELKSPEKSILPIRND